MNLTTPQTASAWRRCAPYLALAGFAAVALRHLIFSGAWFPSHEGVRYFILLDGFVDAVKQGFLYPRWLPDLNGGYGYPTFVFYQSGFFFFAALWSMLFSQPLPAMIVGLFVLFVLAAWAVYATGRILADARSALLAALMYLITPYLYVNLFLRCDLSELFGMLLFPLPVLFLCRLRRDLDRGEAPWWDLAGLAVSTAMVITSNPAITLFAVPLFGLLLLLLSRTSIRKKQVLGVGLAGLLGGAALSAPYWFVLLQMWPYVPHGNLIGGYNVASLHVVYPSQFFMRTWSFGMSVPGAGDTMPFQLGLPHFVLAAVGFWKGRKNGVVRVAFAIYLGLLFLVSNGSRFLWDSIPPLRYVQFPWRVLAISAFFQVGPILGLSESLRRKGNWSFLVLVSIVVALSCLWYWPEFKPLAKIDLSAELAEARDEMAADFVTFANAGEFTPLTALKIDQAEPRGNRIPILQSDMNAELSPMKGCTDFKIRYSVNCPAEGRLTINQIYFPGWKVVVDGRRESREALEKNLTPDGRMQIDLPAGRHSLEAYYAGPPGSNLRNLATFLVAAGLLGFAFRVVRAGQEL